MKEQDVIYVKVKNPIELRRSVLETTKEVIESLQRNERFKIIREEKKQRLLNLRNDIKEIHMLINKLHSSLPKTHKRIESEQRDIRVYGSRKIKNQEDRCGPALGELEKLESELKQIENKLGNV